MDTPRQAVVDFLTAHNSPHLRTEFLDPALEFHVSFDFALARELGRQPAGGENWEWSGEFRAKDDSRPLPGPLVCATIGSNGRNPATGRVSFIGVDIDAKCGHKKGLDENTIERIAAKLKQVPYLQVNHSRSKGIHCYAFLAHEVYAANNSAMYPLGRALMERIAEEIEEPDFADLVDKAGSVMFLYAPKGNFQLLSPAQQLFTEKLEPLYPSPSGCEVDATELDDDHHKFIDWLSANHKKDFAQDGTLFHAHTTDLAAAHAALNLRGEFSTVATGGGDSKYNCFVRPLENGQWLVGQWGNNEATWKESRRGYRFAILNESITLDNFAAECGIAAGKSGYCLSPEEAEKFCQAIGQSLPAIDAKFVMVTETEDAIRFDVDVTPSAELPSEWRRTSKMKACYTIRRKQREKQRDVSNIVRVAYSEGGKGLSYYRKLHGRYWLQTSIEDAQTKLFTLGLDTSGAAKYLTTDTPYQIVNEPFRGEMLSKFKWNRGAIQLAFPIGDPGPYTHWQMILNHCGRGLDVSLDPWCQEHGIRTGADYLMLWQARLFRAPLERLPALSFISTDQNCGKSTFFWSTGMLMTRGGRVLASKALTTGFESLLLGAVLCDLDDVDLSQKDGAIYQKMQSLLTDAEMSIEGKGSNAVQVRNSTHWGHSANRMEACPIQNGDTRFVVVEVSPLEREIPAPEFTRALVSEAPQFLRALFELPMPTEAAGRLYLPVVSTPIKLRLMALRAGNELGKEQTIWLKRIVELADKDRLSELTSFDQLKEMIGKDAPKTARAFTGAWPKLATILDAKGYEVGDRQNGGGKVPAAWYVRKQLEQAA